jgi:phosphoribosylformylglycinamidine synthase
MELSVEVKTLVIYGDGINAENELRQAFESNGSKTLLIHVNELIENPNLIHQYHILAFPGGFSFGDEIRSGKVFALKLKAITGEIKKFKENKKLIIGICNGFQTLVQLNLFSNEAVKNYTLSKNDHGEFKNFWTKVSISSNSSPWLKDLHGTFLLPVRHKEGRLMGSIPQSQIVLKYEDSINGSLFNAAGITDDSGRVLGLMPHPEAALSDLLLPEDAPRGNELITNQIFKNAITYIQNEGLTCEL